MPNMDAGKLDQLYNESQQVDDKMFAEMRSNVLLVSGDHYNKKGSKFWDRVNKTNGLADEVKLRLTKNHVATVCRRKVGKILAYAPNSKITPNNDGEIQDQKTAEMNDSVWQFVKKKHKLRSKIRRWAEDMVHLGECYVKVFWDETKGEVAGYEPLVDDNGEPVMNQEQVTVIDEMTGQQYTQIQESPAPDESKPVMSGDFVFERILAFNLLRDPNAQTLDESKYLIVRKMVDKSIIKRMLKDQMEGAGDIDSSEETYLVFDGDSAQYNEETKKIMLREFYFKPCMEYPNGYYYMAIQGRVLAEGELPFGLFPIVGCGHTEVPTSARHLSPIKQMRPYQIEINRSASKIAETQITLGDDKLILINGGKLSTGGKLAGIRGVSVNGGEEPKVLAGRSGEQYLPYMQSQISELYQVMDEMEDESDKGQFDPHTVLYFSARNKERYRKYAETFEDFIIEMTELFLNLAKEYYDENMVIPMVGKSEMVNIAEFKHSEKNRYRIEVESVSDDVDTMLGRQLSINHTLQYVGGNLEKSDIGRLMKAMPFMNYDEAFGDMTLDYDMSKNDMLAMERGEQPVIGKYDNHRYLIQKATGRLKKADFRFLEPQVQQLYQQYIQAHEQIEAQNIQEIQRAQQGFIPTGGALAKCDYYITKLNDKGETTTKRAEIPVKALEWLEQQLAAQGEAIDGLEELPQGVAADVAGMMGPQQPQMPPM